MLAGGVAWGRATNASPASTLPYPAASEWSEMNPEGSPTPRVNFATVYDTGADRVILFGGYDGTSHGSDETFAYDFETNRWSNLAPAVHPDAGWTHQAAYDSRAGRVIMFGGYDGVTGSFTDATWAFDSGNNTWTDRSPAIHPSVRSRQGMAYDTQSDRVILFGGLGQDGYSGDTWAYDSAANAWTDRTTTNHPEGRRSMGMAYDSSADRIILFGGTNASLTGQQDTWSYDFDTNAWTNLDPPTSPSGRYGFGFAYDSAIDRCILFGGLTAGGASSETWAYDLTANEWTLLAANPSPPSRWIPGMAYDRGSARTILFGGQGDPAILGDTWSLATHDSAPFPPRSLTATAGNGSVSLQWDVPVSDGLSPITGYSIYRGPDPQNVTILASLGPDLTYLDTSVSNGVTYVYRVSATNAVGEGPLSAPADATPDGLPPVTTATLSGTPGLNGWFVSSAVNIALDATDDHSGVSTIVYRLDGGPWRTYDGIFAVAGDGIHAVDFFSRDAVGNEETAHSVYPSIDTIPPSAFAVLSGTAVDAYWFRSDVAVSLQASDATSGVALVRFRLDGGDWAEGTAPFEVGEGRHVIEFFATDVAGLDGVVHSDAFGVDTTAPSANVSLYGARGANGWYVGPVLVSIASSDSLNGATVSYRVDGSDPRPYFGPVVVAGDGRHLLDYESVDGVGNVAVGSASILIDGTVPHSSVSWEGTRGQNGWFVSEVVAVLGGEDDASGLAAIHVRIDGGPWVLYTSPLSLADGFHTIVYFATDVAGNVEPLHVASVSIDTTAPRSIASLLGTAGDYGWYRSSVLVALRAEDSTSGVASLDVQIDGGGWGPYTGAFTLGEGIHTARFAATDVAGLSGLAESIIVRVDGVPPILGTVTPTGHLTTGDLIVRWSGTDDGSGIDHYGMSVDGAPWLVVASDSREEVHASDGAHTIAIRAVDAAGNIAVSSVEVTVDTNVFSFGGPYGGLPTFGIVLVVAALAGAFAAIRRRRRTS